MAAVNLSGVSTSELIDELRLRGHGQAEPMETGRPVEVPTRQAAWELGVPFATARARKYRHL